MQTRGVLVLREENQAELGVVLLQFWRQTLRTEQRHFFCY